MSLTLSVNSLRGGVSYSVMKAGYIEDTRVRHLIPRLSHLSKRAHERLRPPFYAVAVHSARKVLSPVQSLQHPSLDALDDVMALVLHLQYRGKYR